MRKMAIALLALGLTAALAASALAAPLFVEEFSYGTPSGLVGQGGWAAHSGAGTNAQTVNAGNLTYPGYPSSGIGALLGPTAVNGEDTNHGGFSVVSGAAYGAFLINVASSQATGDYIFHFVDGAMAGNIFRGRVFVKKDGLSTNYAFGIQFGSTVATVYTPFAYAPGTTHLVVVKYTYVVGGGTNDIASLFIDPVIDPCTEPTPNVTHSDVTQTDATNLDFVCIRQGSATQSASAQIDGIRVADNWADAVCGGITGTSNSTWGRLKTIYK